MNKLKEKTNIPEGWKREKFNSHIAFEYGSALSKGKREQGITPVYGSNGRVGQHSESLVRGPGIIVGRKGTIGAITWSDIDFWAIDTTYYVKHDSTIDLFWLYYKLQSLGLSKMNSASGTPGLNREEVYKLNISIPPLPEQQKIAEILESVDEDIEKTKATIKATEKLKRGLMQELFTRGIGHTKFKQTELGEIPEGWEVGGFQNFVDPKDKNAIKPGPFGSALKKEFYVPTGYKIYGQEQVIKNNPYFGNYYINEDKYKSLEGFKIQPKDLLISLVGTIGKTMIVPDDAELGIINPRLLKITLDHSKASVYFVDYLLKGFSVLRQTTGKSHGGTMSILNKGMLMSVKIPVPPKDEQEKIAEILLSLDKKVSINKKLLDKQTELKKGLMQDLLSGNKRVTI